jgi:hypothetical protein
VQHKIEKALNRAIEDGEFPVNHLLGLLRSDMNSAYQRKRTAFSATRKFLVDDYNREINKGDKADPEKSRLLADRISANEDRWETFLSSNPGEGLDAMALAHSALVKYARSDKRPVNFSQLVDAMDSFAARAKRIGEAVEALRHI